MNRSNRNTTIDLMTDSGTDTSDPEYPPVKKKRITQRAGKPVSNTPPAKFGGKQKRYKQKYRVAWEDEYPWLRQSEIDEFHFYCVLCEKNYLGGITEITKHESSYKHSSAALKSQGAFIPQAFGKPISRSRPKYPIFFGTVPEEGKETPKPVNQVVTNQKAKLSFEAKLMKIEKEEESSTAVKNIPKKITGVIVHPHSVPTEEALAADGPTGEVLNQITIHTAGDENMVTEEDITETHQSSPPSPPTAQMPSDGASQDQVPTSASSAQELFDSMVDQTAEHSAEADDSTGENITIKSCNSLGMTPEEIAGHIRASQGRHSKSYKQKYRSAWEAEFSWIEKSKMDEFHFRCKACLRDYYGGLSEIMNHASTAKHCVAEYKRLAMLHNVVGKPMEEFTEEMTKICEAELTGSNYTGDDNSEANTGKTEKFNAQQTSNISSSSNGFQQSSIESLRWSKQLVESEMRLIKRRAEVVEVEMRTALLNEHTALLRKKIAAAELKVKEGELGRLGLVFRKKASK